MSLSPEKRQEIYDAARVIAFTGHREIASVDAEDVNNGLLSLAYSLDYGQMIVMHNGFARGFDMLAYSHFWPHEIIVSVPHPVFQYQLDSGLISLGVTMDFWSVDQNVCEQCFYGPYNTANPGTNFGLLMKRNEHMVDSAKEVICYWNGVEKGGTWNTIKYARKVGTPVRDIREF